MLTIEAPSLLAFSEAYPAAPARLRVAARAALPLSQPALTVMAGEYPTSDMSISKDGAPPVPIRRAEAALKVHSLAAQRICLLFDNISVHSPFDKMVDGLWRPLSPLMAVSGAKAGRPWATLFVAGNGAEICLPTEQRRVDHGMLISLRGDLAQIAHPDDIISENEALYAPMAAADGMPSVYAAGDIAMGLWLRWSKHETPITQRLLRYFRR